MASILSVHNNDDFFHSLKMESIDGQEVDFSQYKGKKVLIVNTASECGYTPQYAQLEELHQQYGDQVVVLGFPCNDFGGQEPGSEADIAKFCTKNYGVTFQMFTKITVKGPDKPALYDWLETKDKNGWNDQIPSWNFCKYLVDEEGKLIKYWPS
ncbi:MAG: glutathione peroxidase, partial [Saprospiraceae bacterium]|nr:glutathione peroxidase [Saprospiraceae bacterium]